MLGDEQVVPAQHFAGLVEQMVGEAERGVGERVEIGAVLAHPARCRRRSCRATRPSRPGRRRCRGGSFRRRNRRRARPRRRSRPSPANRRWRVRRSTATGASRSWVGPSSSCPTLSSSGLRSISSAMKVSTSRFDSASRRIACCSCGVITSDCDCRRSRRGARLMRLQSVEALAEIQAADILVGDEFLRACRRTARGRHR